MVSGFPHAGRISTTSCGVIVHRHACIHRSGSRFGPTIAFALYCIAFTSAGSSQCSSSHRSYSSGGHVPASSGAHGHRLITQWYWSKSVHNTRFSSTRRCRSSNPSYWWRKPGYRRSGRVCAAIRAESSVHQRISLSSAFNLRTTSRPCPPSHSTGHSPSRPSQGSAGPTILNSGN